MEDRQTDFFAPVNKQFVQNQLWNAGVLVNGPNAWDIQIHNNDFYSRVLSQGALGLGESYMDKWWDCRRVDIFFERIMRANLAADVKIPFRTFVSQLLAKVINLQSKHRAKQVAERHYDIGNDLFKIMLDPYMMYSCGYWQSAQTLEEAQTAKLDLICQKLQLEPGLRVLDIGCGWGGLAKFAAEKYKVEVVGVTISKEQHAFAQQYCQGLPIDIRIQDYRDIKHEKFDRIVSVGMFEHVGFLNYANFMQIVNQLLKEQGIFLLHTIGQNGKGVLTNAWTRKYVFPNGMLPSVSLITKASEPYFVLEDWHNFGAHYDHTLMAWHHNFITGWESLKDKYDERFYRMWNYYLLSSAGAFRARDLQLWQIVFTKRGILGGYHAPR